MDLRGAIRGIEHFGNDLESKVQIAYGVDCNFIRPMGISMTSILEHNPDAQFHVFLDNILDADRERIRKTVEKYQTSCTLYYVDPHILKAFPVRGTWSVAVYFRFFTAEALYGKYERLLYVDADVLCTGDISPLFSFDMEGNIIAAVSDPSFADLADKKKHMQRIGSKGTDYFNAGIILIDLERWHEEDISNKAIQLLTEEPERWKIAQDQDVLNVLTAGQVYWMDDGYNYRATFADSYDEHVKLVHYSGSPKPWTEFYFSQADVSPFEKVRQDSQWKNIPLQAPKTAREKRFMSKKCLFQKKYCSFILWQLRYLWEKIK
jgi:lipopolysaccharide biosynthesis glycosyltransferase